MIELREFLSSQVKKETEALKKDILDVKKHFDENQDFVVAFEQNIKNMKKTQRMKFSEYDKTL
jgi:hypothetical protein